MSTTVDTETASAVFSARLPLFTCKGWPLAVIPGCAASEPPATFILCLAMPLLSSLVALCRCRLYCRMRTICCEFLIAVKLRKLSPQLRRHDSGMGTGDQRRASASHLSNHISRSHKAFACSRYQPFAAVKRVAGRTGATPAFGGFRRQQPLSSLLLSLWGSPRPYSS